MSGERRSREDLSALTYPSYLKAKTTVDDRALNRHVVDVLRRELQSLEKPRVLEIGGGVGTMVARLADWSVLQRGEYTLLDIDSDSLNEAPRLLSAWAASSDRIVTRARESTLQIAGGAPEVALVLQTVCADLAEFLDRDRDGALFDLVIANAVLDLVDVPATLPALFEQLTRNGLFWFTINFDGETIFLPEHPFDGVLIGGYHRSMNERVRAGKGQGDSRTGRHLFRHLPHAGARILGAGSSDWVVHATNGTYPASEAEFVAHILHTIDLELNWRAEIEQTALREWLSVRREQLSRGELVYIAHQLDFVGRRS